MFTGRNMETLVELTSTGVASERELALVKGSACQVTDRYLAGVRDLDSHEWNEIRFWLPKPRSQVESHSQTTTRNQHPIPMYGFN